MESELPGIVRNTWSDTWNLSFLALCIIHGVTHGILAFWHQNWSPKIKCLDPQGHNAELSLKCDFSFQRNIQLL